MSDRELLELAAKAAGIEVYESTDGTLQNRPILVFAAGGGIGTMPYEERWNPLVDDAQALRLAVNLGIGFTFSNDATWIDMGLERMEKAEQEGRQLTMWQIHEDDQDAATRRAIVRAAASIGQSQENQK